MKKKMEQLEVIAKRFESEIKEREKTAIKKVKAHECKQCKDTGFILLDNNRAKICDCIKRKWYKERFMRAEIDILFENCHFDNYKILNKKSEDVKDMAISFVENVKNQSKAKCMIFSGQVGSGKTHLAVAILNELMKNEINCLYTNYKDVVRTLSQNAMDREKYSSYIEKLMDIEVLLIDDLFKCRSMNEITSAQLSYMYEIINTRYAEKKVSIFTTEKSIDELLMIDEALGSRLFEMANKTFIADMTGIKNYRLS